MKPGDLVEVNEVRGTGYYKHVTALGLGVIVSVCKTQSVTLGSVGTVDLGRNVTVLLDTGTTQDFDERSVRVIDDLTKE